MEFDEQFLLLFFQMVYAISNADFHVRLCFLLWPYDDLLMDLIQKGGKMVANMLEIHVSLMNFPDSTFKLL